MYYLRLAMRVVGRTAVFSLILLLVLAGSGSSEGLQRIYQEHYETFRRMLYLKRIADLPTGAQIGGVFELFYMMDIGWWIVMGLLVLAGRRTGGWMMVTWYAVKMVLVYLPRLLNTPRMPFNMHDRFQMIRQLAILGVAVALTTRIPDQQQEVVGQQQQKGMGDEAKMEEEKKVGDSNDV